jgi:hypothetical protein
MDKSIIQNTEWAKYLMENFLPVNQLEKMKEKFGIELELVFKGEWMDVTYWCRDKGILTPGYAGGNNSWFSGRTLNFGGICGWDITADGQFALCRVAYDDYRLFKVVEKSIDLKIQQNNHEIKDLNKIDLIFNELKEIKKTQDYIVSLLMKDK